LSDFRASFALRRPGWRVWAAGGLAIVVVVVVLIARIGGGGSEPTAPSSGVAVPPSAQGSAEPEQGATAGENDGLASSEASPEAQPAAPGAMAAAVDFVRAWANHPANTTPSRWWAGVSRHTDAALADQLRDVDPSLVPASRVTGAAESRRGGATSAEVVVPTDAGRIVVSCILVRGRWLVADFDKEQSAQ
jgi:hypothetical protein